jgi:multiple sugar transport system substrate-binding protein
MATIKDVAELAGVSISTVSNVINNKGNVREDVYQKVMAASRELQYRPNIIARNLKKQKMRFVAVVLPNLYGHNATILTSVQERLDNLGYYCIIKQHNDVPRLERAILRNLSEVGLSGMLVVPADPGNTTFYEEVNSWHIPVVYMERKVEGTQFSSVLFDCRECSYLIAEKLLESYGPNVVPIVGDLSFSSEHEYFEGFRKAYQEKTGQAFEGDPIVTSLTKEQAFYALFSNLSRSEKKADCYLVTNTPVAQALVEVLNEINLQIPVVSLDVADWWINAFGGNTIDLMNCRVPAKNALEMGRTAVNMLCEYIKNQAVYENSSVVVTQEYTRSESYDYLTACRGKRIRAMMLSGPTSDAIMKQAAGFMRQYECEIVFDTCDYLSLHKKIVSELSSGKSKHDLFMVDLSWLPYFEERKLLLNLKPLIKGDASILNDYINPVRNLFMHNRDSIYGLPMMVSFQHLFYRKDLFEDNNLRRAFLKAHGFDMKPPVNWTEFNIIARFFTRAFNPDSPVEYGTSICGLGHVGLASELCPREWAFGGRWIDENGRPCFNTTNNIQALTNLCDTYKASHPNTLEYWWDDGFKDLINGHVSMTQNFAASFPIAANAKNIGRHYYDIGVAPIPGNRPIIGGWALGINTSTKNAATSYGFLRWSVSGDLSVQNALLGGVRPLKTTVRNPMLQSMMLWMKNAEQRFEVSRIKDTVRDASGKIIDTYLIDNLIGEAAYKALTESVSVQEALQELDEKLSLLIDEAK